MRQRIAAAVVMVLVATVYASALPDKPNFAGAIYGDGQLWGTKEAALLRAPNDHNLPRGKL